MSCGWCGCVGAGLGFPVGVIRSAPVFTPNLRFLSNNFRKIILAFPLQFVQRLCYKILLFEYGSKLRLYEPLGACSELSTFVTAGMTRKAFLRLENRHLSATMPSPGCIVEANSVRASVQEDTPRQQNPFGSMLSSQASRNSA